GNELQDELNLNVYDYGARVYSPDSPRFWQIDPKAEQTRRWSTYSYALGNPVYFVDPDGMAPDDWWIIKSTGQYVWFNDAPAPTVTIRSGYDYVGTSENDVRQDFKDSNNFFVRNFSKPKYDDTDGDIRPTTITAKTNNLIEDWAESKSLIGSMSYNIA